MSTPKKQIEQDITELLSGDAERVIKDLRQLLDSLPPEAAGTANIDLRTYGLPYDSSEYAGAFLTYLRFETESETAARMAEESARKAADRAREELTLRTLAARLGRTVS